MLNSVCKRLNYIQAQHWKAHTANWKIIFEVMKCRLRDRSNSYTYENHVPNTVLVKNN